MKFLIVSYSLTGITNTVMTSLASDISANMERIQCLRNWNGRWGYIPACYECCGGNLPMLKPQKRILSMYGTVVVARSIWGSNALTPLRAFLNQYRQHFPNLALLLAHGGSGGDQNLRQMQMMSGKALIPTLVLKMSDVTKELCSVPLLAFVTKIQN